MVEGGSQAKVMNLVEVITASKLLGAEGRWLRTLWRLSEPEPINEMGRGVVTPLESAGEKNKIKIKSCK